MDKNIETRCTSGLHLAHEGRPCKHCQAIRRSIWSAADPKSAQAKYVAENSVALEEARLFCLEREKNAAAEKEEQAKQYWHEHSHKSIAFRQQNVSKIRAISNNNRARRLQAPGCLSNDLLDRLYKLQKGKCPCCKRALGKDFHMDHIEPLSKGGANVDSNIQLLSSRCNLVKSAMDPLTFMQLNGFLI